MKRKMLVAVVLCVLLSLRAGAADWTTYRGDAARTAYTTESLTEGLSLRWTYRSTEPPQPAWPRSQRMPFDRAFHPVTADGAVFFGSSADGKVVALEADTGEVRWTLATDAPIRFAPAVWKDRIFVASDDGHLYALAQRDGRLLWKRRGGPDGRFILGNQRLISKWPARGGPAVVGDVVYFAAGIWPTDGIYLYALDAESGSVIWKNDDSGGIYMPQPHGGANAASGVSAQGYLVVSGDHLLVPTGRAVPASFDARTGEFEYFHLQKYGHNGGTPTMAVGEMFFNSGLGFSAGSGEKFATLGTGQMAATADGIVLAGGGKVSAYRWIETEKPDRKGKLVKTRSLQKKWTVGGVKTGAALIVADERIVSGGDGRVDVIDAQTQNVVWSADVSGAAYGLAVSDGRLLVSTDRGQLYCFDASTTEQVAPATDPLQGAPYGENEIFAQAAEEIIAKSDITRGYCLDLGCGDGALAYELARRTELRVYAVDDDPKMVQIAREKLTAAGLYGTRVTVHLRDLRRTGYPRYFANLIVSAQSVSSQSVSAALDGATFDGAAIEDAERLQRPYGGVICLGVPGKMKTRTRGALAGAGNWTHQYADPANTLNSDDSLVAGRLSMLWFRDVDFDVPQRHGRAPAPLFSAGRLFHEGVDGIVALDAYNGQELWRYQIKGLLKAYDGDELMGTAGTGSNFCLHGDSVFIRDGHRCLRLDATNGTLLSEFTPPRDVNGRPATWGYIACLDGMLYGTLADPRHVVTYRFRDTTGDLNQLLTESKSFFAMDATTGQLKWRYDARDSIRHNAIAIAGGKVFLIDRPLAVFDREKKPKAKQHPTGRLLALNAQTGETIWTSDEDIYGTLLAVSQRHDALLMSYQPTRFRLDSELGGRMSVFAADSGKILWQAKANYQSRPTINDRTIYTQGGAWDLLSGQSRPFDFRRSYGCGILASGKNMMLFRSATLGYYDLSGKRSTENFGGARPGCWVNALPAGGLVLVPDASSGCRCSYLNKTWFALDSEPVLDGKK